MRLICILFVFLPVLCRSQLIFSGETDLGKIPAAYQIKGDLIIENKSERKIFLMRADADPGVTVFTTKKTLLPGDTCLFTISFLPGHKGAFSKKIELISSDKNVPYVIYLKGDLEKLTTDDKQACYYFGKSARKTNVTNNAVIPPQPDLPRDNSNRLPDNSKPPVVVSTPTRTPPVYTKTIVGIPEQPQVKKPVSDQDGLSADLKPNNLVFLVDISGSMKDSVKLPVMKKALHELVNQLRDVDKLTFITYADTIKIISEACGPSQRQQLHETIDLLKAKGMTKGRKAIMVSQQTAQKHFIEGGNNQIIICTDGQFRFEREDQSAWNQRQGERKIILSTMMFGDDPEARRNLKDIARKCGGSYINVKKGDNSAALLMKEIRDKSKKG